MTAPTKSPDHALRFIQLTFAAVLALLGGAGVGPLPAQEGAPRAQPLEGATKKEDLLTYADLLYSQEQYPLAARQYQVFLKQHPQSPNVQIAWFRLGECYLKVGQSEDAEKTFDYVAKAFRTGPFAGSAAYRLAVMRFNAKKFDEALAYFKIASENITDAKVKVEATYHLAVCLKTKGQNQEALTAFQDVVKAPVPENPFKERAKLEIARLTFDAGDTAKAFSVFEDLANSTENAEIKLEALARAGLLAADLGETKKSENYLARVQKIQGDSPWKSLAKTGLIFNHFAKEEYDKVIGIYTQGSLDLPEDMRPKTLLIVGHSYRLSGNQQAAIETYGIVEKEYRKTPAGAEAGYRRLQCFHQEGDAGFPIYAERYVEQQRAIDPGSDFIDLTLLMQAEWHFARAQTLEARGQMDDVVSQYASAAAAYGMVRTKNIPEKYYEPRLYKMGWSQIEAGALTEGVATLKEFIAGFPDSKFLPSALAKRAATFQSLQDYSAALADYREIIDRFPKAAEVEYALQQTAMIYGHRRQLPEMIAAYSELLQKFPDTSIGAEAHYWIGVGRFDQEKFDQAVEPLDTARKLDPASYAAKGSLRIILCYYQLEAIDPLAREVDAYLDASQGSDADKGKKTAAPGTNTDWPKLPNQVLWYLGRKFFDRQEYERVERFLSAAATPAKPAETSAETWDLLGQSLMKLKKYSEALGPLEHYLSMTQRPSERARAFLLQGKAYLALEKYGKARESARESMRSQKEGRTNAEVRILLGDISRAEGDIAGAAREYMVVSQIFADPGITPEALFKGAAAFREAGEEEKAVELEKQLHKNYPEFKGVRGQE